MPAGENCRASLSKHDCPDILVQPGNNRSVKYYYTVIRRELDIELDGIDTCPLSKAHACKCVLIRPVETASAMPDNLRPRAGTGHEECHQYDNNCSFHNSDMTLSALSYPLAGDLQQVPSISVPNRPKAIATMKTAFQPNSGRSARKPKPTPEIIVAP